MDTLTADELKMHWHLDPPDVVCIGERTFEITVSGIYRITPDGVVPWGPVAPEERCDWCLREFAGAVAP